MATKAMRVKVHVQGDPEFGTVNCGDGSRRFIGWLMDDGKSVRLFYIPTLSLTKPISEERFNEMKSLIEESPIANVKKFIDAITANRSKAKTNNLWDGGDNAMRIIDMLLGRAVPDADFNDSGDEVAQEQAAKLDPAAEGEDGTAAKPPRKKKEEAVPEAPADEMYRPARGEIVVRKDDKDDPKETGKVTEPGGWQSEVKWSVTGFTGFEANDKLEKAPVTEKEPKVAKTAAKKKATAPKTNGAKKKAPKAVKWPEGKLHWLTDENPRRAGTRAHGVVGKTMKLGKVTLPVANEKAGYTMADFEHDKKRKHVELKK